VTRFTETRSSLRGALVLAICVVAADQALKWLILSRVMALPRVIEVTPFFNLVLVENRGISFGLFGAGTLPPWLLVGLAAAIVIGLGVWAWRSGRPLVLLAAALVVGGALGNAIDRLLRGAVIDFVDLHAFGWHWPAFNLADSAIVVGAGVLLLDGLFARESVVK